MKKKCLSITLTMVLILISVPAWSSYTAEVGFVKWGNNCTSAISCAYVFTDNFDTAGALAVPPYHGVQGTLLKGGDKLQMTGDSLDDKAEAILPNNTSLSLFNGGFIVNLLSGLPAPGYAFGLDISNSPHTDYIGFALYNLPGLGQGMLFHDETGGSTFAPLEITYTIGSFTSMALMLRSDSNGAFTPHYWINAPDDFINTNGLDTHWVRFGTKTSSIAAANQGDTYPQFILNEISDEMSAVPEPATLLLLGVGLIGMAGLRRKLGN